MLINKSTTFYVKRYAMSNVYLSIAESQDLISNLTTAEFMLYTTVKGMTLERPCAEALRTPELASRLGVTQKTLSNIKSSLKKKGYLIITFGKDGDGELTAQVFIGKDQVELYNLGLKYEITDASSYRKLVKMFPFTDSSLSLDERKQLITAANEYLQNYKESL